MNESQKEIIKEIVNTFSKLANIIDQKLIDNVIQKFCSMSIEDAIDTILIYLNDLLERKIINLEDVFINIEGILKLNPDKYTSLDDLINRLNWLKSMNMEYTDMPLSANHQLVLEAFDNFNALIGAKFDCYYTGGIMGYLATNRPLERYHGDLDLFINEEQLLTLKELIDASENFAFISNMENKGNNGHEYMITYKDTTMNIGLFLFARKQDNSIVIKNYYFDEQNENQELFVDEHHLSKEYTDLSFSDQIRYHNNIPYKMKSLESIYNSKKNSRPKDKHDAEIIKDEINMLIECRLDLEDASNTVIKHKPISESIIYNIEDDMKKKKMNDTAGPKIGS